mmetsp:Transcript_20265/g.67074  ORF Transcript_20265/g.67074 Transcript_20265/m.67074 type:complete len:111 (+) Transcript_20265:750-1082(+)
MPRHMLVLHLWPLKRVFWLLLPCLQVRLRHGSAAFHLGPARRHWRSLHWHELLLSTALSAAVLRAAAYHRPAHAAVTALPRCCRPHRGLIHMPNSALCAKGSAPLHRPIP